MMCEGDFLKYRGYLGDVSYINRLRMLQGRLVGINERVYYAAEDLDSLHAEFCRAVDEYLAKCEAEGRKPETPFSGYLEVETSPEIHRRLYELAHRRCTSTSSLVKNILAEYLDSHAQDAD